MVDFVSPGKLGDVKTFKELYVEHITKGQWRVGTDDELRKRKMDRRVFSLGRKLDTLVQVRLHRIPSDPSDLS